MSHMRAARGLVALVLAVAFAAACQPTAAPKTPAEQATDALNRGIAAQNSGKTDDAILAYFQTLSIEPKNKFAFYNLGQIYRLQSKTVIAEGYYRQALEVDPEFPDALFGFGFTRLAVGAWQEAADANRKVIAKQPNNAAAHYNLALALRGLGQEAQAQQEFATALRLDPRLAPPASPTPTSRPSATR